MTLKRRVLVGVRSQAHLTIEVSVGAEPELDRGERVV